MLKIPIFNAYVFIYDLSKVRESKIDFYEKMIFDEKILNLQKIKEI